jgi:hypothetical protein
MTLPVAAKGIHIILRQARLCYTTLRLANNPYQGDIGPKLCLLLDPCRIRKELTSRGLSCKDQSQMSFFGSDLSLMRPYKVLRLTSAEIRVGREPPITYYICTGRLVHTPARRLQDVGAVVLSSTRCMHTYRIKVENYGNGFAAFKSRGGAIV